MKRYIIQGRPVLMIDGKRVPEHRYVWEQNFGPIPDGCVIHHVDEDKMNNDINNLVLMTDFAHRSWHGKNKKLETRLSASKKMAGKNKGAGNGMYGTHEDNPAARKVRNIETGEVFQCIKDAGRKYNVFPSNISSVCKGKRRLCAGYTWEYVGENYYKEHRDD